MATQNDEWLELDEAAQILAARGRSGATQGALLRMASDKALQLHVEIRYGAWGIRVRADRIANVGDGKCTVTGEDLESEVVPIAAGVYELIAPRVRTTDGGPSNLEFDGPLIRDPASRSIYQLQERWADADDRPKGIRLTKDENDPRNYYPADRLPDDCRLGVRRSVLSVPAFAGTAESTPSAAVIAQVDRGRRVKRAALIADNVHRWPTIERNLKDAAENGLVEAAKDRNSFGWWFEGSALEWARARGKVRDSAPGLAGLPGVIHRMGGS